VPASVVLIADDDELLRQLMQRALESRGFSVLAVTDGDAALAALAAAPDDIAVVVIDLVMPPHGGLETLARLLEIRPGLGVVLTSGLPPEKEVSLLVAKQRAVFLKKPFAPEALRSAVGNLVARAAD
jgi:DNA-binding NtrC family response regulator